MNCEEARLLIGSNPGADDPAVAEHVAQCVDCARYRQELREMDRVLYAALRVDLDAATRGLRLHGLRIFRGGRSGQSLPVCSSSSWVRSHGC